MYILVKSRKSICHVIPAKAGVQEHHRVKKAPDLGLRLGDGLGGFLR
jgi:hypothetical protein